jgi:hypothetical protein
MGLCNWTHDFEKSFQQRRGYDMRPYLPMLAGHIVTNREVSDRFLEDFRQTVADLAAEAPTSVGPFWQRGPDEVKNVLDRIFCTGVNPMPTHASAPPA